MTIQRLKIHNIPAIIWGEKSDRVYLMVHGKMSDKEAAEDFAEIAEKKGYQTISFDLPKHGEREAEEARCDIWNGIKDLTVIGEYVFANWQEVNLYGCSLGAFFSLHAYRECNIKKCLFQSPIVDMEYLIEQMMIWFQVSKERLAAEKEIDTPIDVLSWDYYRYVLEHPVRKWNISTCILCGGKDDLQSGEVMKAFAERFNCNITIAENSEHPFMTEEDGQIVKQWLWENI